MYANIIDMLQKKGLIKDITIENAENIFLEMTEDEMIPERWRIDTQSFIGDKFPDIADKYTIIKVEKHEGFNDLDKYLDEHIIDNRSIEEIINESNKRLKKDSKEKKDAINEDINKIVGDAFKDTKKMREYLKSIKKRKEEEIKSIEAELKRLKKGEKLKVQEEFEKQFEKKDK